LALINNNYLGMRRFDYGLPAPGTALLRLRDGRESQGERDMTTPSIKILAALIGLAVLTGPIAAAQDKKPTQSARQSKAHVQQGANAGAAKTAPRQSKPVELGGKVLGADPDAYIRHQILMDALLHD
jgi:hypothetical protein